MTRSDRATRVEARLADAGVDALLVTDLVNLRYLTGFTGSNALCVVAPGVRRFVTDFRYLGQVADEVRGFDVEHGPQDLLEALGEGWPEGTTRVGFEDHRLSVRDHGRLADILPAGVEAVPAGGLVEAERMIKEPEELQRIRAAARLADEALREVLEAGLVGRTEREVAASLAEEMRRRGAEPSFPSIVAAGSHGALPHAQPRNEIIPPDTLVTIDWGARLDGYCSDCTRTFSTGSPGEDLLALYDLVERAQAQALTAVRAGAAGRAVDATARDLIASAGHAEHFGHGLGHGVGLEIHEGPRLNRKSDQRLEPGHVVTVEPGVYVPGIGGVRIEDLVLVDQDHAEVLSGLDKGLVVVS